MGMWRSNATMMRRSCERLESTMRLSWVAAGGEVKIYIQPSGAAEGFSLAHDGKRFTSAGGMHHCKVPGVVRTSSFQIGCQIIQNVLKNN
jgi:hypothetical protein